MLKLYKRWNVTIERWSGSMLVLTDSVYLHKEPTEYELESIMASFWEKHPEPPIRDKTVTHKIHYSTYYEAYD